MKKLLFAFPIIALLAAGCNSSQQVSSQTPATQNTSPAPTANPTPTPTQTPVPTATPNPTATPPANSTLYTDPTFNFQVSVPSSYKYETHPPTAYLGGEIIFGITDTNNQYNRTGYPNYQFQVGVYSLHSNAFNKTYTKLSDFLNDYLTNGGASPIPSNLTLNQTTFAQNPAIIVTSNVSGTPPQLVGYQDIWIMHNNLIYEITYTPAGSTLYGQVLSSFTFTK